MMTLHGWQNVRGGPWVKVDMKGPPSWWDPESKAQALIYPKKTKPPSARDAPIVVTEEEARFREESGSASGILPAQKAEGLAVQ